MLHVAIVLSQLLRGWFLGLFLLSAQLRYEIIYTVLVYGTCKVMLDSRYQWCCETYLQGPQCQGVGIVPKFSGGVAQKTSISLSVKWLLAFATIVIPSFNLLEILDQESGGRVEVRQQTVLREKRGLMPRQRPAYRVRRQLDSRAVLQCSDSC